LGKHKREERRNDKEERKTNHKNFFHDFNVFSFHMVDKSSMDWKGV